MQPFDFEKIDEKMNWSNCQIECTKVLTIDSSIVKITLSISWWVLSVCYSLSCFSAVGSVKEAHGSVISHLVSQVRIGMDLTKIVLPTFILEKRSTLEMYADFLAHADLWSSITEGTTPEVRFTFLYEQKRPLPQKSTKQLTCKMKQRFYK